MVKLPRISPKLRILGPIMAAITDFKDTAHIAGIRYALWKLKSNVGFAIFRSKTAGEFVGRSMEEAVTQWIEKGSNTPAESTCEIEGFLFGYSKKGELLYPLINKNEGRERVPASAFFKAPIV